MTSMKRDPSAMGTLDADDGLWSPFELEILLHWHVSGGRCEHDAALIYVETITKLVTLDLIERCMLPNGCQGYEAFSTTERGNAFVEMLLRTPVPVRRYVDPRFEGRS